MTFHCIPPLLAVIKILSLHCYGKPFPQEAWDATLRKDIPRAIQFVESDLPWIKLDPPPANDSKVTYFEIEYLKKLASERSAKDIVLIHKENLDSLGQFYGCLGIEQEGFPHTFELVRKVAAEAYLPILYFKQKYSRARPYQLDASLATVIDSPPHASYPSGHATQGYLIASILAEALAEDDPRRESVMELGTGMGRRREIAGVHYPSDTQAGIELAKQLKDWLMHREDFREAIEKARAELSRNFNTNSTPTRNANH